MIALNVERDRILAGDRAVEERRAVVLAGRALVALLRDRLGQHARGRTSGASPSRGSPRCAGPSRRTRPGGRRRCRASASCAVRSRPRSSERRRRWPAIGSVRFRRGLGDRAAERVDLDALLAVDAAQVAVVGALEAGLADDRARLDAAEARLLQLLRADLADVPRICAAERAAAGSRAGRSRSTLTPGKLLRALGDVGQHRRRHVGLQAHRRSRARARASARRGGGPRCRAGRARGRGAGSARAARRRGRAGSGSGRRACPSAWPRAR